MIKMGVKVYSKGSFTNLERFLKVAEDYKPRKLLDHYGEIGVAMLSAATPVRTGLTAASWYYTVEHTGEGWVLTFSNSNVSEGGISVPLLLQFGHGTVTGGYVPPNDFISPIIESIFEELKNAIREELRNNG